MSLRFICIEARKNLHCANVFLQFDQSLTETEFLKIQVNSDAIHLKEYSTETCAEVKKHFSIEASTISNLVVEECNASFRISINKSSVENDNSAAQTNAIWAASTDPKPEVQAGELISVYCKNCKDALTPLQKFTRVLEFPSGSVDVGELFCHHGPDFGQVLTPKPQDLFYGFRFLVLNTTLLCEKTKRKETYIYCRRCLCYLGETLFENRASKIWCDNVAFQSSSRGPELRELYADEKPPTIQLLHKITRELTLNGELFQHWTFAKVLLQSTFPNRQRRYLLLNILESQLEVLRNTRPLAHGSIHNNNNILQVDLKKCECFKLLYRYIEESGESTEEGNETVDKADREGAPLLAFWKQDISTHLQKISPTLFRELLLELDENSLLLPEVYRFSNDGFQLSYVFYN